jgi:hypothetical protein
LLIGQSGGPYQAHIYIVREYYTLLASGKVVLACPHDAVASLKYQSNLEFEDIYGVFSDFYLQKSLTDWFEIVDFVENFMLDSKQWRGK